MSSLNKGLARVEVAMRWDPSPSDEPDHDLDLVAATYSADALHGDPAYLVYFDSRSPDGTITLNRDSRTGQGLGFDEVMTIELDRLAASYARVLVGVAIQQPGRRLTFGDVQGTGLRIRSDDTVLAADDFGALPGATAAIVAEFTRDPSGVWRYHAAIHGFVTDPSSFARTMGWAVR
jgi:tellurium resistance protein TerD